MSSRKTYRGVEIKLLDQAWLLAQINGPVVASIDVAKAAFAVAIVVVTEVLRIVRFEHPTETTAFLELLKAIRNKAGEVIVLMEPTSTYGDALRYQLGLHGFEVRRVQPKHTHDAKELWDGTPSKHDNKDSVTLAKLHASGASSEWRPSDEMRRGLRALFDGHLVHAQAEESLYSRIEARLARHWPEFEQWLSIRKHASARALLEQFQTPQQITAQPDQARAMLQRASRGLLSPELIEGVIDAARNTLGMPMVAEEAALMKDLLDQLRTHLEACDRADRQVEKLLKTNAAFARMKPIVGPMAAAAALAYLGPPAGYHCARAWDKAAGLNLCEISSGTHKGDLRITKRGPSIVRKLMYMAALRATHTDPIVRAWYHGRTAHQQERTTAAVVAVMRKLHKAIFYVGKHDVAYDATKLFDTRRLDIETTSPRSRPGSMPARRTTPRSITRRAARAAKRGGARA